jgi:hypothetical protein
MALGLALCLLLAAAPVNAAGETTSLQLVTKCAIKSEGGSSPSVFKYSYNKNGLFSKESTKGYSVKYTYKDKNLKKGVAKYDGGKTTTTFKTKNGLVVKSVSKSGKDKVTSTFSYKNKRLAKEVQKYKGYTMTTKFTYNKKGLISKKTMIWKDKKKTSKSVFKYTYDKNGYPTKINYDDGTSETIKNTYKDGLLVKKKATYKNEKGVKSWTSFEYTYSKKNVPAAYATNVQAQQKGFLQNLSASTFNY